MAKRTRNQHAANALLNVLRHATENALPMAVIQARARAFCSEQWWAEDADWDLAFSRLVYFGKLIGHQNGLHGLVFTEVRRLSRSV
jgi:hypothetical protein